METVLIGIEDETLQKIAKKLEVILQKMKFSAFYEV